MGLQTDRTVQNMQLRSKNLHIFYFITLSILSKYITLQAVNLLISFLYMENLLGKKTELQCSFSRYEELALNGTK